MESLELWEFLDEWHRTHRCGVDHPQELCDSLAQSVGWASWRTWDHINRGISIPTFQRDK